MARDKEFEWRMQGMTCALDLMRKYEDPAEGLKALEAEMKVRGYWRIPHGIPRAAIEELASKIKVTITNGVMKWLVTTIKSILHDKYGFGELRQNRFISFLEFQCECIAEKRVTIEDLAEMLEESK